jgi:hypothetical protein
VILFVVGCFLINRKLVIGNEIVHKTPQHLENLVFLILENKNTLEYFLSTEPQCYSGINKTRPVCEALLKCKYLHEFVIEGRQPSDEQDKPVAWRNIVATSIAKSCPLVSSLKIWGYTPAHVICEILNGFSLRTSQNPIFGFPFSPFPLVFLLFSVCLFVCLCVYLFVVVCCCFF